MEIVSQEEGTLGSSMAVKNCEVTDCYPRVDPQILYALIRVFHALSLTYVTHYSTVESLNEEFKGTDAKS